MPSDAQGHGSLDRARYPDVRERIGEDPAQYLDKDLFETSYNGDCSVAGWTMKVRIQSIDSFAVLGAWIGVERNLDRGPRDRVMKMLNERAQELEAMLGNVGFEAIEIAPKGESTEFISDWDADRDLSEYLVSATIEARKPPQNP